MEHMEIFEKYSEVPSNALKSIAGGRLKGMSDINPMWRIQSLTEQFGIVGIGWYYIITDKRLETYENEVAAFVDIELYIKDMSTDTWSKPIVGTGGSSFVTQEKNGSYMSDECFKMALTDAISVACKALGFGSNVYWSKSESKYNSTKTNIDISSMKLSEIGKLKVTFGKHKGSTLKELLTTDKSYSDWLLKAEKTDQWLKDALTKLYDAIEQAEREKVSA